jgi:pimeloyl-ACP methyl ester carboxylesterase
MPRSPARKVPFARLSGAELAPLDSVQLWPGHHVDVDGVRIHVRTVPSVLGAEPALFVHGLGGSSHNWTELAGLLRDQLAVEAIDLMGHGRSGPAPHENYSIEAHANVVIRYLEQSGRGPVHLVGNSMGGAVSISVAARRPDLVRTLTLISPAVPDNRVRAYPLLSDARTALLVIPGFGEFAMRKYNARISAETRIESTIAMCFADPTRYSQQRRQEAAAEARAREAMPWADVAVLRSMRGLAATQYLRPRAGWAQMAQISAPTLVLWGDADRLVAPDLAPYVAGAIADSRLLVLEHVGHTAMMELPQAAARAVLALVEDVASVRA